MLTKKTIAKVNKITGLSRKLQRVLPRSSLVTIYESFVTPHLEYDGIIFDRAFKNSFHQRSLFNTTLL